MYSVKHHLTSRRINYHRVFEEKLDWGFCVIIICICMCNNACNCMEVQLWPWEQHGWQNNLYSKDHLLAFFGAFTWVTFSHCWRLWDVIESSEKAIISGPLSWDHFAKQELDTFCCFHCSALACLIYLLAWSYLTAFVNIQHSNTSSLSRSHCPWCT